MLLDSYFDRPPEGGPAPTSRLSNFFKFMLDFNGRGNHTFLVDQGQRLYPPYTQIHHKINLCAGKGEGRITSPEPSKVSVSTASITTSQMFRYSRNSASRSAIKHARLSIAICSLRLASPSRTGLRVTTALFRFPFCFGEPPRADPVQP